MKNRFKTKQMNENIVVLKKLNQIEYLCLLNYQYFEIEIEESH
jgi:hypothetical protein